DIDPNYSLGAMQKERQETLERLQKEGVLNANQMLSMSLLPKRLAIISQSDSKGYSDFITLMNAHPNKYKFATFLFEATLQGDAAIESIRAQLRRIEKMKHLFDAVVIVRGGGGEIGMHCYNNYQLAKNIACFPLPILTGIGHSTNLTVCEMVAFHNGITPSDLAYYMLRIMEQLDSQLENSIIQLQHLCSQRFQTQKLQFERDVRKLSQDIHLTINQHQKNIIHLTHETSLLYREVVSRETNQLYNFHQQLQQHSNHYLMSLKTHQNNIITTISNEFSRTLEQTKNQIQQLNQHIENQLKNTFSFKKLQLESIEKSIELSDPQTILKRGFAIVSNKKGILSAINTVNSSDEIIIRTATQEIEAQVTNIKNI
ncbi:MAG TPA: exodeoxyribonuclease VII large subunit, partial [Fluviicola sp.]|nr:exodeoxyribonuclease VII large subunit [Fluviicola sp.]